MVMLLGGGFEIALSSDIIVASKKAKFGFPEVTLGIIPGFGGTQNLPRAVGPYIAKELIFSGRIIDAQEAYNLRLVSRIEEPDNLINSTIELAKKYQLMDIMPFSQPKRL